MQLPPEGRVTVCHKPTRSLFIEAELAKVIAEQEVLVPVHYDPAALSKNAYDDNNSAGDDDVYSSSDDDDGGGGSDDDDDEK